MKSVDPFSISFLISLGSKALCSPISPPNYLGRSFTVASSLVPSALLFI